jgi:hypothetical protein
MHDKLLPLHQNLIYPAFLGAALVNFAQLLLGIPISRYLEIDWLWLALGLWFILYFGASFLVLLEAQKNHFRYLAFLANLAEVFVILFASIAITQADPFSLNGARPGYPSATWPTSGIEFWKIFASWLAIPLTAGFANWFSQRPVKVVLSLFAMAIAVVGLCASMHGTASRSFDVKLTALMFIALIFYFVVLAKDQRWLLDFDRTGFWTLKKCRAAARVRAATDAASRAQQAAGEAEEAKDRAVTAFTQAADAAAAAQQAADAEQRAAGRGLPNVTP